MIFAQSNLKEKVIFSLSSCLLHAKKGEIRSYILLFEVDEKVLNSSPFPP